MVTIPGAKEKAFFSRRNVLFRHQEFFKKQDPLSGAGLARADLRVCPAEQSEHIDSPLQHPP